MVADSQEYDLGTTPPHQLSNKNKGLGRLAASFTLVCLLGVSSILFFLGMGLSHPNHFAVLVGLILTVVVAPVVAFSLLFSKYGKASRVLAALPAIPVFLSAIYGLSLLSDNDQLFGDIMAAIVLMWAGMVVVVYGWFYYEVSRFAKNRAS